MKVLVLSEHNNQHIKSATYHTLSAAKQLGTTFDLLVIGYECTAVAQEAAVILSVDEVLLADNEVYAHQLAENCAELIAEIGKNYDYILAGATTFGKNVLPRVAALLDVGMISDVIKIENEDTYLRPIYAGNIIAKVRSSDKIKVMTIRTTAFPSLEEKRDAQASITSLTQVIANPLSRFENESLTQSARPELTSARVIVAGGRGLKSADNFHLLETIADQLGGAVGASRAAVDAGFAPNDYQVGQTGKVVAPDLYIAVGISGAIQHLAGMKDSKIIVAINNDPEAPIFEIADYILVGDLFTLLPELQNALGSL
ncbi:MAG: electron transfer flavoprotein subunit alpha/FixB family protein [Gammaproteobacteria bacterium]|nr:electron transfer flavoprotein subunit alpha/FixB family protein [Gammaproteobacteria bacterium]